MNPCEKKLFIEEDGWVRCPFCGKKLCRARAGAVSRGILIKCKGRECHREIELNLN